MGVCYISRDAEHEIVWEPARTEYIATTRGNVPISHPGLKIRFENKSPGFKTKRLPLKGEAGRALGFLDAAKEAERLSRPDSPITEKEVCDFLDNHNTVGVEYARAEEPNQHVPQGDEHIQVMVDGTVWCNICEKQFRSNIGMSGHISSKTHQRLAAEAVASSSG